MANPFAAEPVRLKSGAGSGCLQPSGQESAVMAL